MQFIAHRGYWKSPKEKNAKIAFERALELGFGLETDVRDLDGKLVISHDPAKAGCLNFDDFLEMYRAYPSRPCLALNIKSDGLQDMIKTALERFDISNYFVFDMSVPDSRRYFDLGFAVYTRRSEFEVSSALDSNAAGIWLDCFLGDYVSEAVLRESLDNNINVALVSPELHGKSHLKAWNAWYAVIKSYKGDALVSLCTDYPEMAKDFFLTEG